MATEEVVAMEVVAMEEVAVNVATPTTIAT